ncbi:MAG: hypothetical protein ABSA52_08000 [Candidatus Binatia bacterium]|jgi:hypothetical protein
MEGSAGKSRAQWRKVPRTYRLAPEKVAAAQRALGSATATEAIETALELVLFRRELIAGTRAMLGVTLTRPEPAK